MQSPKEMRAQSVPLQVLGASFDVHALLSSDNCVFCNQPGHVAKDCPCVKTIKEDKVARNVVGGALGFLSPHPSRSPGGGDRTLR